MATLGSIASAGAGIRILVLPGHYMSAASSVESYDGARMKNYTCEELPAEYKALDGPHV